MLSRVVLLRDFSRSFRKNFKRAYASPQPNHSLLAAPGYVHTQRRNILFKMGNETPSRVVGYYVLFPMIPDHTVENNSFLYNIAKNEDWPRLSSSTPEEMYEGTVRLLMEFGATVQEHLEHLEATEGEERTFESVLEPLLTEEYEVNYAFNTLLLRMLTDWPECSRKLFDSDLHHIKIMCAREHTEKLSNVAFQKALNELYSQQDKLTEWQARLVEWYLLEIKASGWDRQEDKTRKLIGSWSRFIDEFRSKYMSKWATGPWRGRMTPGSLFPFVQYCEDRQQRALAWEKWTSKASFDHDFYNNSINIEELRHNNEGLAKTLGYASVAEHRLSNKMAASPDTVRNFLLALSRRMRPAFMDRMEAWTTYAQSKHLISQLQPHDLFYICRKEAEAHYEVDSLDLMNHFPFWPTFDKLCSLLSHIFHIKFEDVTSSTPERCHHDVRVYAVTDLTTGEELGRVYIDPFDRERKMGGWNALLARTGSSERKLDKLVYVIGCALSPSANSPSLLHHTQLSQLLHTETGRSLSEEEANRVSLALSRSMLWESYRSLFWADFDLSIYEMENRKDKFWLDMYREMHKEYFPFALARNDYHPCSFMPIFALQPHMGMYYRKLWTEMLALDIHETFDREENERKTGERLKTTLLSRGSADVSKELYRRFQGRDPSVGAICDFYDPPSFYDLEETRQRREK